MKHAVLIHATFMQCMLRDISDMHAADVMNRAVVLRQTTYVYFKCTKTCILQCCWTAQLLNKLSDLSLYQCCADACI